MFRPLGSWCLVTEVHFWIGNCGLLSRFYVSMVSCTRSLRVKANDIRDLAPRPRQNLLSGHWIYHDKTVDVCQFGSYNFFPRRFNGGVFSFSSWILFLHLLRCSSIWYVPVFETYRQARVCFLFHLFTSLMHLLFLISLIMQVWV